MYAMYDKRKQRISFISMQIIHTEKTNKKF